MSGMARFDIDDVQYRVGGQLVTVPERGGRLDLPEPVVWGTATSVSPGEIWVNVLESVALTATGEAWSQTSRRLQRLEAMLNVLCEKFEERATTYSAQIHSLANSDYSLRYPLLVTIESYDEEVVASIPEFDLYASGVSDAVALMNLKSEIVSTYERLIELGSDRLGPLARQCLDAMKQVIEPKHA